MPLTEVYLPHAGTTVKLGRSAPAPGEPRMKLANYMSAALPAPPPSIDYWKAATVALAMILLNNKLGCCVISGIFHILCTWIYNAGKSYKPADAEIQASYSAIGGYVPGRPGTDRGCNEQDALNYYVKNPFPTGDRLLGYVAIDATNATLVKQALWLFENVMFGVAMPNDWVGRDMPQADGFVWDVAGRANPNNGHCFIGTGYTAQGVTIDTWGMKGTITWAAVARYAVNNAGGELYVLLSEAMLIAANKRSPGGIDEATLVADMNAFGANLVATGADPSPLPPPPDGFSLPPVV